MMQNVRPSMTRPALHVLTRRYAASLRRYLADREEAGLEKAYGLGRLAIAQGLGSLDLARIHHDALCRLMADVRTNGRRRIIWGAARNFFLESLSPYEATHRGFSETNVKLQQAVAALAGRNAELGKINRTLKAEIGERRRVEQALRESERRFSLLIETANDVIFSLAADGRIVTVNRAFEKITGWPRTAWVGRPFAPLIHPDEMELAVERFLGVLKGKRPETWQYRVRKADGQYVVGEFTLSREVKAGKPVGVFGIGRDITERKRVEEALQNLSRHVLQAQEDERGRISRELHDQVGQSLTAISMALAAWRNNGAAEPENRPATVAGIQRLLEETTEAVHRFARELRPAMLDDLGLLPALRSHAKNFSARTGLRVLLRTDSVADKLNDEQKVAIFRVVQESLTNVAKHARASRVKISLRHAGEGVCMEVADNGKSFHPGPENSEKQKQRLGLLGMQERVRLVNGQFAIKPYPGRGTTVCVTIPFTPAAAGP